MATYALSIEQLRRLFEVVERGGTLEELRGLYPSVGPGYLAELFERAAELRRLRAASAGGNGNPAPAATATASPAPPASRSAQAAAPWQFVMPAVAPPAPPSSPPLSPPSPPSSGSSSPAHAELLMAVGMIQATMTAMVEVLKAERQRSPWAELPQLMASVRSLQPDARGQMTDYLALFREGIKLGAESARLAGREGEGSMWAAAAREVAGAVQALADRRGASPEPAVGVRPATAGPSAPRSVGQAIAPAAAPAPPARAALPGPPWDPLREVCAVIDYGLTTEDDPAHVAAVMRAKLPQDILLTLQGAPVDRAVEWIERQRRAIPALSNPQLPHKRAWLEALVRILKGEKVHYGDDEDSDDEDGDDEDGDDEDGDDEDGDDEDGDDEGEPLPDAEPYNGDKVPGVGVA